MKRSWLHLSTMVLLFLILFPISTAQGAPPNAKIAPALRDSLAAGGRADFIVRFSEQADLTPAFSMDWHDRGWFVYETLQATAARSQARAIDRVKARGLEYTTFSTGNALYVHAGDLRLAETLAVLPEVVALTAPQTYYLDPLIAHAAAQPEAPEWGVLDVKADQFWNTFGLQGEGSVVANIGTGVAYLHPALDQAYKCGAGPHAPCWFDPTNTCPDAPCDDNGHGTAMTSLMVGDDDLALPFQVGVAPGAQWIACKGCGAGGSCSEYNLLACAGWILAPADDPNNRPAAVHNSWGGAGCNSWFLNPVLAWVAAGILPAFPPGGSGPGCGTIGSPGDYAQAFAAAGHDSTRNIAPFSARGPSCFTQDAKPNVSAPGVAIRVATPPDTWQIWSGTSLSTAFPPGVAALLWSCAPHLLGDIEGTFAALQSTADTPPDGNCGAPPPPYGGNYTYGYGYLNALAAGLAYCMQGPGTLHGHVYAAGTGNPLAGAVVTAIPGPFEDTTDAQGYYSMTLDAGTYTVTAAAVGYSPAAAVVEVAAGLTTTHDFSLTLLVAPTAAFSSDSPVCLGDLVHFTDESTGNPPVHAWWWDLGDGSTSTEQHPSHLYTGSADYIVTLRVTNTVGSDEVTHTVTVHPLPWAAFAHAPPAGPLPLTVYFTNTSLYATNPTWALGDGTGASGDYISHTYDLTGTYYVTLTVTSPYGCGAVTASAVVTVYEPGMCLPVAIVAVNQSPVGCVVTLDATLDGDPPFTYLWSFALGTFDVPAPQVDFGATGVYTGTLEVWNCDGDGYATRDFSVDVNCDEPPPPPVFKIYLPLVVRG